MALLSGFLLWARYTPCLIHPLIKVLFSLRVCFLLGVVILPEDIGRAEGGIEPQMFHVWGISASFIQSFHFQRLKINWTEHHFNNVWNINGVCCWMGEMLCQAFSWVCLWFTIHPLWGAVCPVSHLAEAEQSKVLCTSHFMCMHVPSHGLSRWCVTRWIVSCCFLSPYLFPIFLLHRVFRHQEVFHIQRVLWSSLAVSMLHSWLTHFVFGPHI